MAKIMVVDDDLQVCEMMTTLLRASGHQVNFALDPSHLYTQLQGFQPDLLIMDMQMPAGGGPFAKKVVDQAGLSGHKIIFHSSMPVDRMKEWFPPAPNHRYAQKPVPLAEFSKLVADFLAG